MTILILGKTGLIGRKVYSNLERSNNINLVYYDRKSDSLINKSGHTENIDQLKFHALINCSGSTKKGVSMYESNIFFPSRIINKIKKCSSFFIIHLSSYGIYNGICCNTISLHDKVLLPNDEYEKSKFIFDSILINLGHPYSIIYPTNVIDINQNFKFRFYEKFIKHLSSSKIYFISSDKVAEIILKELLLMSNNVETVNRRVLATNSQESRKAINLNWLKRVIHLILIKTIPSSLKYYLFFFEYRKFSNEI